MTENTDNIPLTGAILSLIVSLQSYRRAFIHEAIICDDLNLPRQGNHMDKCKNIFFHDYKRYALASGLQLNESTFKSMMRTNVTDELLQVPTEDLPNLYAFNTFSGVIKLDDKKPKLAV